jgi:hypothetical protein
MGKPFRLFRLSGMFECGNVVQPIHHKLRKTVTHIKYIPI